MMLQEAATLAFLIVLSRAVPKGQSFFRENKTLSWLQSQVGFLHWKDFFLIQFTQKGLAANVIIEKHLVKTSLY